MKHHRESGGRSVCQFLALSMLTSMPMTGMSIVHAATCESLGTLKIGDTTLVGESVAAGAYKHSPSRYDIPRPPPDFSALPPFCRVTGSVRPTKDSDIRFEVWLPVKDWNGKLLGIGSGGLAGTIGDFAMAAPLARGYAVANTDTGHQGRVDMAEWALGHPQKVVDFGHRAVHEMTRAAKAVISAYYGSQPRHAYWDGCSEGGHEGLSEAQRYPEDYDGIAVGAPANYLTHLHASGLWVSHAVHKDPPSFIPSDKLPAFHTAVLKACDAIDGVVDGVLEDPRQCTFDVRQMQCRSADGLDCFTAAQIEGIRKVYGGTKNPRTGQQLFPGPLMGSELDEEAPGLHWMYGTAVPPANLAHSISEASYKFIILENASWDWKSFDFDKDVAFADRKLGSTLNAIDPDLSKFKARGGKLLQYHGWGDPSISPLNSVNYYRSVQSKMGDTQSFYRLFMVPGMAHCQGGPGTDQFDKVAVLERWVEQGIAPDQILASHATAGKVDRTRPLCPLGKVAKWKGTGSTDDAANFACAAQ